MSELTKDERISKEIRRLKKIYRPLQKDQQAIIEGLIKRAAFMRVSLEILEDTLNKKGFTEEFTQSKDLAPYNRERPEARIYNSMNKNYQGIMKQLTEFVSKDLPESSPKEKEEDEYEKFLHSKEE